MKSFWQSLHVPFTVLAPMEGVTDVVFRKIIAQIGRPDVFFTEFTNCDGLMSKGRRRVEDALLFSENEQPVIAQIWGLRPENYYKTAQYCREKGFAGIDINMGCPVDTVIKKGACSALIKNHALAKEIIDATKDGAGDLPVSVKTRIGFDSISLTEWIGFLLKQDLAALTLHFRTVRELSKVPAHWECLPEIMKLRQELAPKTLIIGNGDVGSLQEVKEKYDEYGCEGFMIGRGIFSNPWLFNANITLENISIADRLDLYLRHISLFEETWEGKKNPDSLKKFAKTYIQNFPDAGSLREKVVLSKNITEMQERISSYKDTL